MTRKQLFIGLLVLLVGFIAVNWYLSDRALKDAGRKAACVYLESFEHSRAEAERICEEER